MSTVAAEVARAKAQVQESLLSLERAESALADVATPVVGHVLDEGALRVLIDQVAAQFALPVPLVRAMVQVESDGNPWALRYEPAFYARYIEPKKWPVYGAVSQETEKRGLATSWGLLQIMGSTAREMGFRGAFLSQLCDPRTGLWFGCKYLARQRERYDGGLEQAVVAYNAGSARKAGSVWVNQVYLDKVRAAGW